MSASETLKKTPLYQVHVEAGGKMVPFAGYEMPVQYRAGILAEHKAVREDAGLFDVSHMGEIEVTGPDRNAFVNRVTCNDISALRAGEVQYSAVLDSGGTFIDDCTVYRFEDKLMVVVNASNADAVWEHFVAQKRNANIRLKNISDDVGLLALQGPRAEAVLQTATATPLGSIDYYTFRSGAVAGKDCFISRTGYTGEDGFELYCRAADTETLWHALVGEGKAVPCGLGARDILRLEMAYALYGNEIDDTISPLEAGLGWIVKLDKGSPFVGDAALRQQKSAGVTRRLVGFRLREKAIARPGYPVYLEGKEVDRVRSGVMSPSVGAAIGTTFLPVAAATVGTTFEIDCRGKRVSAEVVKRPFWQNGSAKKK
jgi:aminomethyltransferase